MTMPCDGGLQEKLSRRDTGPSKGCGKHGRLPGGGGMLPDTGSLRHMSYEACGGIWGERERARSRN